MQPSPPLSKTRLYRTDEDAVIVIHWFEKKTAQTPGPVLELCRARLREYDHGR